MTAEDLMRHHEEERELQDTMITRDRLQRFRDTAARCGNRRLTYLDESIKELTADIKRGRARLNREREKIREALPESAHFLTRQALELYILQGFSVQEMAAALEYRESQCRYEVNRAARDITGKNVRIVEAEGT